MESVGSCDSPRSQDSVDSHGSKVQMSVALMNSPYFKIRALLCELRPLFIQILKTPDFRNCQAAHEIVLEMKRLQELYKEMVGEKSGESSEQMASSHQEGNDSGLSQNKHPIAKSGETNPQGPPFSSEKKPDDLSFTRVSYIVGGSAVGWNFITFLGNKPTYYGVSKKLFRSRQKKDPADKN